MQSKFSDSEKTSIVSQYWDGQSVAGLCKQYGIPRSTLYSWLKPYHILRSSDPSVQTAATQKEYADLKRRADKQAQILEVIRRSGCSPNSPLEERLSIFQTLQGQYSARILCEALNISRGTYHNRIILKKEPNVNEKHRSEVRVQVRSVFEDSKQRYGADKILAVLTSRGIRTSKKYILELMHEMGLQSISVQAKKNRRAFAAKQNIVQREFDVNTPDSVWVSDVTCFKVKGYYLYICVILDLFSRKVLAYRISPRNSTQLITSTFNTAFSLRQRPKGLVFHSDRGAQYTSSTFRRLLSNNSVTQSFSHSGKPHDNAVAESFFVLLKREELYRRNYQLEKGFRRSVDDYIQFYNQERPHRNNKYKSPDQFEVEYHQQMK